MAFLASPRQSARFRIAYDNVAAPITGISGGNCRQFAELNQKLQEHFVELDRIRGEYEKLTA